jgi:hypothetical protein
VETAFEQSPAVCSGAIEHVEGNPRIHHARDSHLRSRPALATGADFGGNATIIGASANVILASLGEHLLALWAASHHRQHRGRHRRRLAALPALMRGID